MNAFTRSKTLYPKPVLTSRPADGYFGLCLGNGLNFNQTLFRSHPKPVKGKAAIKRAKRAKQAAR